MNAFLLFAGIGDGLKNRIRAQIKGSTEEVCNSMEQVLGLFPRKQELPFDLMFAGSEGVGMMPTELAQALKMTFPSKTLYFVSEDPAAFDRIALKKNGFDEAFLLPMDTIELEKAIGKELSAAQHKFYTPVRIVDIEPNTKLEFQISVYLPANDKYLVYSAPGDVLEESRLDRLKKHQLNSIYVPISQLPAFYDYSAKRLKELSGDGGAMSETERREKLRASVRELVSGMLSDSYSQTLRSGMKVANHAKHIVSQFILANNPTDLYLRLKDQMGEKSDSYSHTQNVSTYAALFSLATGRGNTEDIAVAGIFHDLGVTLLPPDIQQKPFHEMSGDELLIYRKHPEQSVELLRARRLVVSELVTKIILQHHEKWNGEGFPNKYEGKRICVEAQLLALADRFDYLTRVESNRSPLSHDQALTQMEREKIADPGLLGSLKAVFKKTAAAA